MSATVHVELGARSYEIQIGHKLLDRVGEALAGLLRGKRGLLVTDSTVASLYASRVVASLSKAGLEVVTATIPAGETSKDGRWLFHLYERAAERELDRRSWIVALGGGVVGDLAGFAAATYLRGLDLVQVPTTLLAMVDSAVGGKTGINLPQGKNLVGSFHQPRSVLCDLDVLQSLPRREFVAGLAEVVKYGVIRDSELFREMETRTADLLALDGALMARIVARSCEIKADVVGQDERETSGVRATLNFGHTLGHAIETVTGYARFLHGEAIAIGMVFAARLSQSLKGFSADECARLVALLQRLGLPTAAPELPWPDLVKVMGVDKKSMAGRPRFVLAERLGRVVTDCEVSDADLRKVWQQMAVEPTH